MSAFTKVFLPAALVLLMSTARALAGQSVPTGQTSHLRQSASAPAVATGAAVPAVKAPAAAVAPKPMDAYRESLIQTTATLCGIATLPPTITNEAVVAYQAADEYLAKAPEGGSLTVQQSALNAAVCNVTSAVLNAEAEPAQAAREAQKTELQNATPDLEKSVRKATEAVVKAVDHPNQYRTGARCSVDASNQNAKVYTYPTWMPLFGSGCTADGILNFYNLTSEIALAQSLRYLYGVTASSNAISSDLVTGTFPLGFQMKLGANVTTGASDSISGSGASGGSGSAGQSTDSAATAISKFEQGGDFYVQALYPVMKWTRPNQGFSMLSQFVPRLGFTVNGLGSQQTITQATDVNAYYPLELYAQFASISATGSDPILMFFDGQFGGESIGADLAKTLNYGQNFYLGQYSAGLEFNSAVRVSFQRFQGPSGLYSAAGSATLAQASGWHLAVELRPKGLISSKGK